MTRGRQVRDARSVRFAAPCKDAVMHCPRGALTKRPGGPVATRDATGGRNRKPGPAGQGTSADGDRPSREGARGSWVEAPHRPAPGAYDGRPRSRREAVSVDARRCGRRGMPRALRPARRTSMRDDGKTGRREAAPAEQRNGEAPGAAPRRARRGRPCRRPSSAVPVTAKRGRPAVCRPRAGPRGRAPDRPWGTRADVCSGAGASGTARRGGRPRSLALALAGLFAAHDDGVAGGWAGG